MKLNRIDKRKIKYYYFIALIRLVYKKENKYWEEI